MRERAEARSAGGGGRTRCRRRGRPGAAGPRARAPGGRTAPRARRTLIGTIRPGIRTPAAPRSARARRRDAGPAPGALAGVRRREQGGGGGGTGGQAVPLLTRGHTQSDASTTSYGGGGSRRGASSAQSNACNEVRLQSCSGKAARARSKFAHINSSCSGRSVSSNRLGRSSTDAIRPTTPVPLPTEGASQRSRARARKTLPRTFQDTLVLPGALFVRNPFQVLAHHERAVPHRTSSAFARYLKSSARFCVSGSRPTLKETINIQRTNASHLASGLLKKLEFSSTQIYLHSLRGTDAASPLKRAHRARYERRNFFFSRPARTRSGFHYRPRVHAEEPARAQAECEGGRRGGGKHASPLSACCILSGP